MLDLLYQDEWLIAVDKPAGQLVHPADIPKAEDVVTMKLVRDQIGQEVELIHRLDCPTSGVLLFAKDKKAARRLRQDFEQRRVTKRYLAAVIGEPEKREWICEEAIQKDENSSPKPALTEFTIVKCLRPGITLVEARPHTGRFHQIRRHLLQAGCPIVGDYRYVGIERCDALGAELGIGTRMLLQAKTLTLTHPISEKELEISAPDEPLFARISSDR